MRQHFPLLSTNQGQNNLMATERALGRPLDKLKHECVSLGTGAGQLGLGHRFTLFSTPYLKLLFIEKLY